MVRAGIMAAVNSTWMQQAGVGLFRIGIGLFNDRLFSAC